MTTLTEARIANVRNHMALEVTHDWDAVIATFEHPRYEMHGGGQVFDGEAAVRRYFELSRTPFPDQDNEIISIAADEATDKVLVEFWLTGTHTGPLTVDGKVIEPTGGASGYGWRRRSSSRRAATASSASGPISTRAWCCGHWTWPDWA